MSTSESSGLSAADTSLSAASTSGSRYARTNEAMRVVLSTVELRADHPITCLNPHEWFKPTEVNVEDGRVWVRDADTCWFSLAMCDIRRAAPSGVPQDSAPQDNGFDTLPDDYEAPQ